MRYPYLLSVLILGAASSLLLSQVPEAPAPTSPTQDTNVVPLFHSRTSLVLVDVIAQSSTTGAPLNMLRKEDFRLFDNKQEVPVTTFDSGAHYNTRPIALWFVVICNEKNNGPNGQEA